MGEKRAEKDRLLLHSLGKLFRSRIIHYWQLL